MSEDRKARLAELRKNRANNRGSLIKASPESQEEGSQDASPPRHCQYFLMTIYKKPPKIKKKQHLLYHQP